MPSPNIQNDDFLFPKGTKPRIPGLNPAQTHGHKSVMLPLSMIKRPSSTNETN